MICQNCGFNNADNSAYCLHCGTILSTNSQQFTNQYNQNYSQQNGGMYNTQTVISPAIANLKTLIASPLFLIATISISSYFLLNIFASILGSSILNTISSLLYKYDLDYLFYAIDGFNNIIRIFSFISCFITQIPVIVTIIGLWLLFISAKDVQNYTLKTIGFDILKITQIIKFVESIIFAIAIEIGIVVLVIMFKNMFWGQVKVYVIGVAIVATIINIIANGLNILFYSKSKKSIDIVKNLVKTGVSSSKISTYVIVFTFVFGGFSAIDAIRNIASSSIIFVLSKLCLATSQILFGVIILNYNKKLQTSNNYNNTSTQTYYNNQYVGQNNFVSSYNSGDTVVLNESQNMPNNNDTVVLNQSQNIPNNNDTVILN